MELARPSTRPAISTLSCEPVLLDLLAERGLVGTAANETSRTRVFVWRIASTTSDWRFSASSRLGNTM